MPNYELVDYPQRIEKHTLIQVSAEEVWKYLTVPALMKTWMGDEEMEIEIMSDWKIGGAITIKGFHHMHFENKGTILQLEVMKIFQYEYLSSLSNLEDEAANYTSIAFRLHEKEDQTELTVEAENFPTFEIYKHLEFYWNGTLPIIRLSIEKEEEIKWG